MLVLDAELEAARTARVRLAFEPKSALNLVTRDAAAAAGIALAACEPVEVDAPAGGVAVLAERASARVRVAGRELEAVFYAAPWPLAEGAGALVGAPTMNRRGLSLTPDHAGLRP